MKVRSGRFYSVVMFSLVVMGLFILNEGVASAQGVTTADAIAKVQEARDALDALDPVVFDKPNDQDKLTKKLDKAINQLGNDKYKKALNVLQKDIIDTLDGCNLIAEPDEDDKILDCVAQGTVYPLVIESIDMVGILVFDDDNTVMLQETSPGLVQDGNINVSGNAIVGGSLDVAAGIGINESAVIDANGQWVGDPTGLVGPQGPAGADGATGPQGQTGLTGADGATGSQGPMGLQGPVGSTGPAGADGVDGMNGVDGADGADGATGSAGADGTDGATGLAGADGADGATGPAGADGAVGATGPAGADGADGATGPAGADGIDGINGVDGADGATGSAGADGADGTDGTDGVDCANLYDHPWLQFGTDAYYNDGNVGIGTTSPGAKLEVNGEIKIGNSSGTSTAGMIRWTGADFEGYTGTEWVSLTGGGASTGGPADPETVLLLHMDGNVQSFADSSVSGHNVTAVGDATQTNSSVMTGFGNSSYFDGNGDYLAIPDSDDWDFGSGDFTIDTWVNFTNTSTNHAIASHWGDIGQYGWLLFWNFNSDNKLWFEYSTNGSSSGIGFANVDWVADANTWYHLVVTRDSSSDIRFFVNGVQQGVTQSVISTIYNPSQPLRIGIYFTLGGDTQDSSFLGYIDELRISKGVARWTSNFTPPNSPYGN
ncbi:MAG: hypothetical protein GY775_04330 [Candidatus Scalindua sp.]|nr:hypothetical protein [Candidatus Scalindua sp.]